LVSDMMAGGVGELGCEDYGPSHADMQGAKI